MLGTRWNNLWRPLQLWLYEGLLFSGPRALSAPHSFPPACPESVPNLPHQMLHSPGSLLWPSKIKMAPQAPRPTHVPFTSICHFPSCVTDCAFISFYLPQWQQPVKSIMSTFKQQKAVKHDGYRVWAPGPDRTGFTFQLHNFQLHNWLHNVFKPQLSYLKNRNWKTYPPTTHPGYMCVCVYMDMHAWICVHVCAVA